MAETALVSPDIRQEALSLAKEILRCIEESDTPISNIALKAIRLARLLNDSDYIKIFDYEVNGYPSTEKGVSPEVWRLATLAKRVFKKKDEKTDAEGEYAYIQSIKNIEDELAAARAQCERLPLPDRNLASMRGLSAFAMQAAYPIYAAHGQMRELSEKITSRKSVIHDYASKKCYELKFTGEANNEPSPVQIDDKPQIIYKYISERSKRWVRFCLVQIDYDLSTILPPAEFGWKLSNEAAIEDKVFKALEIARLNEVDIICFPELSSSKEIADKISKTFNDMIVIGGSYYDDGYNVCPVLIYGYTLNPFYSKCTPSIFETDRATGRGMKAGNFIFILQTQCGRFSVLTCSDYPEFSERVCRYNKGCDGVDFIINPCCDASISRFQEKASSDCDIFAIDIIQVNKAPEGSKYGRSCIIGREHDAIIDIFINEKLRPESDVRHKLCELSKESMLIADIDIDVKGPLAGSKPDYHGRIKIMPENIYEFNGNEWLVSPRKN